MMQMELVIEDIHDCLREIVRALGGHKRVGPILWPEKAQEASSRLLADCLNTSRSERLTPEQTIHLFKLARQAGFHAAKRWFDEETGYIPSEPMEPEDERAKLQRAFIESVNLQARIVERMASINAAPTLRAVGDVMGRI